MSRDIREMRREVAKRIFSYECDAEFRTLLYPVNVDEQRLKFLRDEVEDPIFVYRKPELPMVILPPYSGSSALDDLYRDRMEYIRDFVALLKAVGQDEEFTKRNTQLYAVNTITQDRFPCRCGDNKQEGRAEYTDCGQMMDMMRNILRESSLHDWTVLSTGGMASRMIVNPWKKQIWIREDFEAEAGEVKALLRHEVGVHVTRAANAEKQREPLLRVGTRQGRFIEEGIAAFAENPEGPPRIFLRHRMVVYAQNHSFRGVWTMLVNEEGCTAEQAWEHTLRVKRGLRNGKSYGGFLKDCIYAQGFKDVCTYLDSGGSLASILSAYIHPNEVALAEHDCSLTIFPFSGLLQNLSRS